MRYLLFGVYQEGGRYLRVQERSDDMDSLLNDVTKKYANLHFKVIDTTDDSVVMV